MQQLVLPTMSVHVFTTCICVAIASFEDWTLIVVGIQSTGECVHLIEANVEELNNEMSRTLLSLLYGWRFSKPDTL